MAASPVTGERPAGFRRSSSQFASIPQRSLSFHEKVGLAEDDAAANVLYTHPSVRIYSFQPPTDALNSLDKTKKTLPDADYPIDAIEVLPWRARTETLAARGKLIIEKVQGSVHFLKAGELIYTIMKNSQCWCVDGESKFVMRVGRLRYQRIEMPTAEAEDKQKVEEFKDVIGKILKFEKTPCPFIRAFHVDLPEDAITPRRRGTWKRKESLTPVTPEDESGSVRRSKTSRTMSMRGMPPSAFPSRSLAQLDTERPRTASTPISTGRFSFPDMRTESPIHYTSGEENTDSDRHDSESDRPGTGHSSEFEESDRETNNVPLIKSPLKNVETVNATVDEESPPVVEAKRHEPFLIDDHPQNAEENAATTGKLGLTPPSHPAATFSMPASRERTIDELREVEPSDLLSQSSPDSALKQETSTSQNPETYQRLASVKEQPQSSPLSLPATAEIKRAPEVYTTEQERNPLMTSEQTSSQMSDNLSESIEMPKVGTETTAGAITLVADAGLLSPSEKDMELDEAKISPAATLNEPGIGLPTNETVSAKNEDDAVSVTSFDSFRTVPSDDEEKSALQQEALGTRPFQHRRELSEITVVATLTQNDDELHSMQVDGIAEPTFNAQPLDHAEDEQAWPEMHTPGAFTDGSEIRQRLRHRRSLSPLPPASILQTGNQVEQYSPIPAVLLQKAATLTVVKPLEVFVFIVQVLARIAGGATMNDLVSGDLFRRPGVRRTASGTFDQAVRGRQTARESDEEDDYGVPVHGRRKSSNKGETPGFAGTDIDDAASFASID